MDKNLLKTSKPTVLLANNNRLLQSQATHELGRSGFQVTTTDTGHKAIQLVNTTPPDLVVLDTELPDFTVPELCALIRSKPHLGQLPILMLTDSEDDESIEQAYKAGATDFANRSGNWKIVALRLHHHYQTSAISQRLERERQDLAAAQRIAKLGSWQTVMSTGKMEWSDQLYQMLEINPNETEPGIENLFNRIPESQQPIAREWFKKAQTSLLPSSLIHRIQLDNGQYRYFRHQIEPEVDFNGSIVRLLAILQDITERVRDERKIRELEQYDSVTSLPNRHSFKTSLENAISIGENANHYVGVINLSLSNLKKINGAFGQPVGDDLIKGVAERINSVLRTAPNTKDVARVDSDEFSILLNNITELVDIEKITKRILQAVAEPFIADGRSIFTTPSVGIAIFPKDGTDAETLMNNAGIAMQQSKLSGNSNLFANANELRQHAIRRFEIEAQLRDALEKDEFSLVYQPQVHLESRKLSGIEALLRWDNSDLGALSPLEFISIAEENGLIVPIGEWVLRSACQSFRRWQNDGLGLPKVAVNISTAQFVNSDLPSVVDSILSETGVTAERLELEVTESVFATDNKSVIKKLNELNEMGVILSIDDFGTGYSSLSQLKEFPKNRLKIDRSFVKHINDNIDDMAISKAIINMAKSMNISVLAEGVENLEQLNFLIQNGCDEIQGYLLSKPIQANQLAGEIESLNRKVLRLLPTEMKKLAS